MKRKFTSDILLLTVLSCLLMLINAVPSAKYERVGKDANRLARDESDKSSGSSDVPVTNERKLTGRPSDAQSKCGYEV